MQDPSLNPHPHLPEQEQLKCPRCDSTNTKFCYYNNYNLSQPRHFCKNCRRYWTKGGALRNIPVGGGSRKNTKRSSTSTKRANPDSDPSPESTRPAHRLPQQSSSSSPPPSSATAGISMGIGDSGPVARSGQGITRVYGMELDPDRKMLDMGGSFSSLLTSSGQFGNLFYGLNSNGPGLKMVQMDGFEEDLNSGTNVSSGRISQGLNLQAAGGGNSNNGTGGGGGEGYLQSGDWGNSNGWPDLAIYTPGSSFQ